MRRILQFVLFSAKVLSAQIQSPQLNLTGNIGCQGFPCLNNGTLIMADTNYGMTALDTSAVYIKVTSSVSLTATRNLISPVGSFFFTIENATTGGQAIQIIGASGTGVAIPNGATVAVWNDGTKYVQIGFVQIATGTPNLSVTGTGCSVGSIVGGTWAGSFTLTTTGATCILTITLPTATHGWVCSLPSSAAGSLQTSSSTTTAVYTFSESQSSGTQWFQCAGY